MSDQIESLKAQPKISVRDLYKSFGTKAVLEGINLDVEAGKSLVIIGGSGTGKSVLLKCILGLICHDKGDVFVDGARAGGISHAAQRLVTNQSGMLFQGAALFDSLKVWENVAFRLLNAAHKRDPNAKERALNCLAQVGLSPEIAELKPAALSGGMQKRVSLARAIVSNPKILFFDEPTTGLDPIMSDVINNLIIERVRALGATAITITHDMKSARKIADEIAMMYRGRIIWRGTPDEMDATTNPMVQQFIHGRAEGPIEMTLKSV